MTIKEFFSIKKNAFFWINILVMIVVMILLVFLLLRGLDKYTRHGQAIVVPDAKGMNVYDANSLFAANNLQCLVSDSMYVKDKPAGCVLEQNPANGQRVKKDRVIYLTVNTRNVPLMLVPDVADNSSRRQAEARIQASGFKLTEPEVIAGEKDWVYGVKYNGTRLTHGEKIPTGATLTLIVGNGRVDEKEVDSLEIPESEAVVDDSWF